MVDVGHRIYCYYSQDSECCQDCQDIVGEFFF